MTDLWTLYVWTKNSGKMWYIFTCIYLYIYVLFCKQGLCLILSFFFIYGMDIQSFLVYLQIYVCKRIHFVNLFFSLKVEIQPNFILFHWCIPRRINSQSHNILITKSINVQLLKNLVLIHVFQVVAFLSCCLL